MFKVYKGFSVMFVFIVLFLVFCSQVYAADSLLGSTGNIGSTLITINTTTGLGTPIAPHGAFGPVTEIEARSDGVLFGATGGGSGGNIITINPVTGAETLVGAAGARSVNALEFVGPILYGSHFPGGFSNLVTVNQSTGALTVIAPILVNGVTNNFISGLAYDQSTGTMYGVADIAANSNLVTINLTTGVATVVGPIGVGPLGAVWVTAMDFDNTGVLYGATARFRSNTGSLLTINTATGAGTLVGATGFPGVSGITFLDITDTDGDTIIDLLDTDDDNDGVLDGSDTDPLDPDVCEDVDADTCDDCAIGTDDFGPLPDNDPFNDGPDSNGDGKCDAAVQVPTMTEWGMIIFMLLAATGAVYYLRRRATKA